MNIVQEVEFPDVSFYQADIDFSKIGKSVILRAGQNLWIDPKFEINRQQCVSRGINWGAYWFYDDRISPVAQADKLFSLFNSGQARPNMEIWCDWETSYGGQYSNISYVVQFMQRLELLMPWARVGIYTGYYWFIANSNSTTNVNQYNYLKDKPLWLAWYTAYPNNVLIPKPWIKADLWQYGTPARGHEFGVGTVEIDMNWFNGTVEEFNTRYGGAIPPVTPPIVDTGEYHVERWYDSDAHIVIVDTSKYRVTVTNTHGELVRTSTAASGLGAKIAVNGDGWIGSMLPILPFSLSVSDGDKYKNQTDFRPFANFTADNIPSIRHSGTDLYNTVSGTRYIIMESIKPTYLFGNDIQYTELHPRTAIGIRNTGEVLLVVVDGRTEQNRGVTLSELADIMIDHGCHTAIDMDGGGSSTLWYDGGVKNIPSDGSERYVVNHLAFISLGDTMTTYVAKPKDKNVALYFNPSSSGAEVGRMKIGQSAKGTQTSGIWLYATVVESGITGWLDTRMCTVTEAVTTPPTPNPVPVTTHIRIELEGHVPFDADIEKLP
jgi:GH25 family lysozyme M1 (1,4-beta-N-acetylmuramidase)